MPKTAVKPRVIKAETDSIINASSLVTIPNVPIVSTGTYHLASGMTTFTEEHLRAAVAAQDDPAVTAPRLKIGHTSDFGDGEPSFGTITGMHLGDNDQTIYADYVGVPIWLAELMPTAYPARSIEGAFDAVVAEGKAPHALLITAVSLLGVVAPGVSTLEDLQALYGEELPQGIEITASSTKIVAGTEIIAKSVGGDMPKEKITAAVSVDDVRREFYDSLDSNQAWWWICRIEVDPMQLIVDDEEGGLWRVGYDPSGTDVTFEEPVEVEIVYVDVGSDVATAAKAAVAEVEGSILASFTNRSESRPDAKEKGGSVPKGKAKTKASKAKQLRASLGLSEDATEKEVAAALKEAQELLASDSDEDEESEDEDEDEDESGDEDEESEESDDEDGEDEEVEAGTATIDKATLAQLQKNSELGVAARKEQLKKEREDALTAAVKAGKFPRARKGHWRNLWKKDPEGTKASIDELEAGLVPVQDVDDDDVNAGSDGGSATAYESAWLSPGERARIAAAHEGSAGGGVTMEVPVK